MASFLTRWIADIDNNELIEGFCIGLLYGSPAWFALPVFAFLGRRKFSATKIIVLLGPAIAALLLVFLWGIVDK